MNPRVHREQRGAGSSPDKYSGNRRGKAGICVRIPPKQTALGAGLKLPSQYLANGRSLEAPRGFVRETANGNSAHPCGRTTPPPGVPRKGDAAPQIPAVGFGMNTRSSIAVLTATLGVITGVTACGDGAPDPVEPANQAPVVAGAIPTQQLTAGETATIDLASYFSDPDGDALTYLASGSNASVVSVSVSGSTLTMVGVAAGSATVTVAASDPGGLSAQQDASVTVEPSNQAPEAAGSIPGQTIAVDQTATVDVAPYFSDPDGDPLTYLASGSNASVISVSVSGSTLTIVGVAAGSATVTVTASDPGGLSAQQSASVTVERSNRAPDAVGAIPDQAIAAGQTATVDVAPFFSDPDGDPLTYAATTSNIAVAAVSLSGSTLTIAGVAAGSATVTVTATDPGGLTVDLEATVTVQRLNQGPQAVGSIPDQTVPAGQTVAIDASLYFSDPDGDPLTYAATSTSIAIAVPSVSGTALTIAGVAPGTATVAVTATDPGGLAATQSVNVNVGTRSRDREALEAFHEGTSGDFHWRIDTNWLSDRPLGTWYGVTTDDDGRVIELSLPGNNVWGPIPQEFVLLQKLKRLNLSDNRVSGALPAEIGDLLDLEELNLGDNTFLGSGTSIPAALGKLDKLMLLDLSDTGFREVIPLELGNLQSLTRLDFSDMTWLDGSIPPEFGRLSNLRELDVSESGMDGALPQELINVPLELFHWNDTRLCSPGNQAFQTWLRGIADHQGETTCGSTSAAGRSLRTEIR